MSFKFEFQMNSCCMWGFSGVESIPLCLWVPMEKPGLTTSNALSNLGGLIAFRRRLLARGARRSSGPSASVRSAGQETALNHGDNDNRDRLFNPLCAAILCACVWVAVTCALTECHTETNQEVGNWSQELSERVSSTTRLTSRPSILFQI